MGEYRYRSPYLYASPPKYLHSKLVFQFLLYKKKKKKHRLSSCCYLSPPSAQPEASSIKNQFGLDYLLFSKLSFHTKDSILTTISIYIIWNCRGIPPANPKKCIGNVTLKVKKKKKKTILTTRR